MCDEKTVTNIDYAVVSRALDLYRVRMYRVPERGNNVWIFYEGALPIIVIELKDSIADELTITARVVKQRSGLLDIRGYLIDRFIYKVVPYYGAEVEEVSLLDLLEIECEMMNSFGVSVYRQSTKLSLRNMFKNALD